MDEPTQFRIIWWNVQRLFAPGMGRVNKSLNIGKKPESKKAYLEKINNLAAVIRDLAADKTLGIIGLCEVENSRCVSDLIKAIKIPYLKEIKTKTKYDGHDVVIIYNSKIFSVISEPKAHSVHNAFSTRDIFEVEIMCKINKKKLVFIANHWPSRLWTGSDYLRYGLAAYCKKIVNDHIKISADKLFLNSGRVRVPGERTIARKWHTPVIVAGDFNDEPFDLSIRLGMKAEKEWSKVARTPNLKFNSTLAAMKKYLSLKIRLYNPMWTFTANDSKVKGTNYWSGRFFLLDQVLFSSSLLNGKGGFKFNEESLNIYAKKTIRDEKKTIKVCSRNNVPVAFDSKRRRGVSDHLPLYFDIEIE